MNTGAARKLAGRRCLADHSTLACATLGLLLAGFLLSPIGSDLMFRLGVRTGEAIFSWADGDRLESALPR